MLSYVNVSGGMNQLQFCMNGSLIRLFLPSFPHDYSCAISLQKEEDLWQSDLILYAIGLIRHQ